MLIFGGNVTINSTINHKDKAGGGTQGDYDLIIDGSKSVTIAADVGAGQDVSIFSGGPLTISGNVLSDTDSSAVRRHLRRQHRRGRADDDHRQPDGADGR